MGADRLKEHRRVEDYHTMRRWLFVLAVVGALLILILIQVGGHYLTRSLQQDSYAQMQRQLLESYQRDVVYTMEQQAGFLEILLHNPVLSDALRERDREVIMREVYWRYQLKVRENPFTEVLHFHDPDNITILRLHQPARYGDDLTELRPMIARANREGSREDGFEIGKNGISYRVALPIQDDDEHLGVVELGINISYFTQRLSEMFGVKVGVLFYREAMQTYFAQHGEEGLTALGDEVVAFASLDELLLLAGRMERGADELFVPFSHEGSRYVAHRVFGIDNYLGEEVGEMLVIADVSEQAHRIRNFTLWSSVAWSMLMLLLVLGQYRLFCRMQSSINQLAFYDALTGLPNRRLLIELAQKAVHNCVRTQRHLGLLFIDLDNFKQLNDSHGHHYGDELLKQVAVRLHSGIRANDAVGRQGGDEFVVVLEGLDADYDKAVAQAMEVANKLVTLLYRPYVLSDDLLWNCSGSIGLAVCDEYRLSLDELMRRADVAMYQAKAAGKNQVAVYRGE